MTATRVPAAVDDRPLLPALANAAEGAGVAVLAAPADAAWGQLHTLLRTARSASSQRRSGGAPVGDLFGLADTVSSLAGGAITVEDESSVVLAHSSTAHPVDGARRDTILGRRVPAQWLAPLHEQEVFRRLWSSDEVVRAVDLVVLSCRAFRLRVVPVATGGTVYAVLPARASGSPEARQVGDDLLAGKVAALHASDRSTAYVPRLRSFLDAFGDVRTAADLVGVHPNTFRYRLRRLAGLDLDDLVERLVVHLQLHLLGGLR